MVTYAKIPPKMVNPRDLAGERRRRRQTFGLAAEQKETFGLGLVYLLAAFQCAVTDCGLLCLIDLYV